MLVNREGFVPDAAFETLTTLVRGGIDLATRVRAAASEQEREDRRKSRAKGRSESDDGPVTESAPATSALRATVGQAQLSVKEARRLLAAGMSPRLRRSLPRLSNTLQAWTRATLRRCHQRTRNDTRARIRRNPDGGIHSRD